MNANCLDLLHLKPEVKRKVDSFSFTRRPCEVFFCVGYFSVSSPSRKIALPCHSFNIPNLLYPHQNHFFYNIIYSVFFFILTLALQCTHLIKREVIFDSQNHPKRVYVVPAQPHFHKFQALRVIQNSWTLFPFWEEL